MGIDKDGGGVEVQCFQANISLRTLPEAWLRDHFDGVERPLNQNTFKGPLLELGFSLTFTPKFLSKKWRFKQGSTVCGGLVKNPTWCNGETNLMPGVFCTLCASSSCSTSIACCSILFTFSSMNSFLVSLLDNSLLKMFHI